jgi:hypothetical protein
MLHDLSARGRALVTIFTLHFCLNDINLRAVRVWFRPFEKKRVWFRPPLRLVLLVEQHERMLLPEHSTVVVRIPEA